MKNRGSHSYQRSVDPSDEYTEPQKLFRDRAEGVEDECSKLTFTAQIQNPKSNILSVKNKDKLPIILSRNGTLNVYDLDGKICGVLIHPLMEKLKECINKGNSYVGVVVLKDEEICNINIQKSRK